MANENRNLNFSNPTAVNVGAVTLHQSPNAKAIVAHAQGPVAVVNTQAHAQGPSAVANTQVRVATKFESQNVQVAGHMISRQCAQIRVEEVQAQVGNVTVHGMTDRRPSPNEAIVTRAPLPVTGGERGVIPRTSQVPAISPVSQNGPSVGNRAKAEVGGATPNRHVTPSRGPLPITNGERGLVPQATQLSPTVQNGAGQVVERTGAATKKITDLKIEKAHVEAGNIAVGALRAEAIVEEERKVVRQAAEFTDDGEVTYRQIVHTERVFHRRIIEIMYIASLNEPEHPEEPTRREKCIDCCCQSVHCNFSRMPQSFTRRDPEGQPAFKTINYMTPILRRGRSKGWAMHMELIPGIVRDCCRNWWVFFELVAVIAALGLSIATFSLGKNRIFNILHLILTILGSILAVTDGIILLCGCSMIKKYRTCCECVPKSDSGESPAEVTSVDQQADVNVTERNGKCKRCIAATRSTFDFFRMLLSELLFYPLLICDIFEVITGKAYLFSNVTDGISFTLFAISSVSLFFFVYIVRIIILIVANIHSQRERKPETKDEKETQSQFPDYDPAIRKAAKYFQCYFIYHVAAQMLAQILMIVAIGAKIRDDNSHLFEDEMNDDTIHVSGTLWYMLVAGYVLPVFGLLTFFVVTYFWVQEFPIGFCIDCLSVLKASGIDEVLKPGETKKEAASNIDKIKGFVQFAELKRQFKDLRQKGWSDKFFYPFKTSQMVIICLIYALLQFSFIICAGNSTSGNGPLGGGYWEIFYTIGIIVGFLANFYVFLVALLWSAIIISVIVFIAILISLIIFCCLIMACVSSPNNNRQRY